MTIIIIIIIITMYYSYFCKYRRADTRMGMSVRPSFRQDVSRHVRTLDGYCYWGTKLKFLHFTFLQSVITTCQSHENVSYVTSNNHGNPNKEITRVDNASTSCKKCTQDLCKFLLGQSYRIGRSYSLHTFSKDE
jgi:hypothetical protein